MKHVIRSVVNLALRELDAREWLGRAHGPVANACYTLSLTIARAIHGGVLVTYHGAAPSLRSGILG